MAHVDAAATHSESIGGRCPVVVRDRKLVYERHYNGSGPASPGKSGSLAKSLVGTLVGIMLRRGELQSADELASDDIPERRGTGEEHVTPGTC